MGNINENPSVCLAKLLHFTQVTVCVGLSNKGIVRPFFTRETVNSLQYIQILQQFITTF